MNLEIKHLWSHKCPKKWDQYTLIALVITIIVLIILAGVSISMILGQNGLVQTTKGAIQNYQFATNEEQTAIINLAEQLNSNTEESSELPAPKTTYSITYNYKNGINITNNEEYEIGKKNNLKKHEYELDKCTFVGWATTEKGDVVYTDEQEITDLFEENEDVQLYARYSHTHNEDCEGYALFIKSGGTFSSGKTFYNIYTDEDCTIPATVDFKVIKPSITQLFSSGPVKVTKNNVTYYIKSGTDYYKEGDKITSAVYYCQKCHKYIGQITPSDNDDSLQHYHSDLCGLNEGLQ